MAHQTATDAHSTDDQTETYYRIMTCPSDNSEAPTVFERGYSFRPAANDRAFELGARDDGRDYWAEQVEESEGLAL